MLKKMLSSFLGEYQDLKRMIFACFHRPRQKWMCGACLKEPEHAVCYTTFVKLWEQFHPDVVVAKPMTNLCLTCQQNTSKLLRSANLPEREKSECVIAQQGHLTCVKMKRDFYNNICSESQSNLKRLEERIKLDEKNMACSIDTTIHYSFDFAQ